MPLTETVVLQVVPLALSIANGYLIESHLLIVDCLSVLKSDLAKHDCQVIRRHLNDPLELKAVLPR